MGNAPTVSRPANGSVVRAQGFAYTSEGGYLRPGKYLRAYGNLPRPTPLFPHVFTSIYDPRLDEILAYGTVGEIVLIVCLVGNWVVGQFDGEKIAKRK